LAPKAKTGGRPGGSDEERLSFGGMARWDGLDLFGPNYSSIAYRKDGEIHVRLEPSRTKPPKSPLLRRVSRWPVVRSFFFWGRLVAQVAGSVWVLVLFAAILGGLWLFVRLMELGSDYGPPGLVGGALGLFAQFPVLPFLLFFLLFMKFSPIGRYHGAEHKAVAAYERFGEVTLEGARTSNRLHPRCGTNILIYIVLAALLDPLIPWWPYAILQFILISEAWYAFGRSRPSIAVGNFLQKYFTTAEPRTEELEVAVRSLNELLGAERQKAPEGTPAGAPASP
jgi:uncharacterized membrane protein